MQEFTNKYVEEDCLGEDRQPQLVRSAFNGEARKIRWNMSDFLAGSGRTGPLTRQV